MTTKKMLEKAIKENDLDLLNQAFANGAQVNNERPLTNGAEDYRNTIYFALENKASSETLKILFENGAQVNNEKLLPNGMIDYRNTIYLALKNKASPETLKILFENGAQVNNERLLPNGMIDYRKTIYLALENKASPETLKILFENGAQVNNERLLPNRIIDYRIIDSSNTIYFALENKASPETLKILFENGADPQSLYNNHPKRQKMIDFLAALKKSERDQNDEKSKYLIESNIGKSLNNRDIIGIVAGFAANNTYNGNDEIKRVEEKARQYFDELALKENQEIVLPPSPPTQQRAAISSNGISGKIQAMQLSEPQKKSNSRS